MVSLFKAKRAHRRAGDAHRDAGRLREAVEEYGRHLGEEPDDAAIWVQLGHLEKEMGHFDRAETAYERAAALRPSDPDALLHLSHMLKSLGQTDAAASAFARLYVLDPSPDVLEDLYRLRGARSARPELLAREGAFAYVIEDLIGSLETHTTLSGIQRVQAGVILAALDDPTRDVHLVIVNDAPDAAGWTHLRIDRESMRRVLDYVGSGTVEQERLRGLVTLARLEAVPVRFGAGTTIVVLGSFWGYRERPQLYLRAKRDGARLVLVIYDLIALTHPQFCDANLVNTFWRTLAEFLPLTDGIITISEFTKKEVANLLREEVGRLLPIRAVPLAHTLNEGSVSAGVWPAALSPVRNRRYVAYVSTIEGRKNHLYVVRAWQRMIAAGISVPDLVFVGRFGWRNEELLKLLEETRNLGGRVHVVHGLTDAELNAVYAGAQFTVFTSFTEGWGLPVGESLVHGVPCVASRAASMPEVGGEFVDYVDPADLDDGVRVFTRLICDQTYLAERQRAIRTSFSARTWREVGRDFEDQLASMSAEIEPAATDLVTFEPGAVFRPGDLVGRQRPAAGYFRSPMGLALSGSFGPAGPDGAWMRGGAGTITFRAEAAPGADITLFMAVAPAPGSAQFRFSLSAADHRRPPRWISLVAGPNLMCIDGRVDEEGAVTLRLTCDSIPGAGDGPLGVALLALGYCVAHDRAERRAIRERFFLAA